MDLEEKIALLADSAKYDVSCASSGSNRSHSNNSMGHTLPMGVCHSWASDGRCVSLLKILMTNSCIYDCAYCLNRRSNNIQRVRLTVDELVFLTMNFYKRNYIEGLFLSSGIIRSPDYTMEQMMVIVKRLRVDENFGGYIHVKSIPGADRRLINITGLYADRMSINIELPTKESIRDFAPDKNEDVIINDMGKIAESINENREDQRKFHSTPSFVPAGQSTQMVIGASPESDKTILIKAEDLYKGFSLKRVYYSAYIAVNDDKRLPVPGSPPLRREHRLYQADWLLRFYGFTSQELFNTDQTNLDLTLDPKTSWALRNPNFFPVELTSASREEILRIPGVGEISARRILNSRREGSLSIEGLKRIGVVLKRAQFFATLKGKTLSPIRISWSRIGRFLGQSAVAPADKNPQDYQFGQNYLFPEMFQ